MNRIKVRIWDRDFELNVSYQNYPGEAITVNQKITLSEIPIVDFLPAKIGVENYIKKHFSSELGNESLNNIFSYVMPKSILIPRNEEISSFAVMCSFKLDMEHGIALIFENGQFKDAGPQDLIL